MNQFTTYQLADDLATYGADAGKFIVTSANHEQEFSGPMKESDAEILAKLLTAAHQVLWKLSHGTQEQPNTVSRLDATVKLLEEAFAAATGRVS